MKYAARTTPRTVVLAIPEMVEAKRELATNFLLW
jgi:hypothetical protein